MIVTKRYRKVGFKRMTFEIFMKTRALRFLSQEDDQFPGFRECLTAAFAAHLLAPSDRPFGHLMIANAVSKHVVKIERSSIKKHRDPSVVLLHVTAGLMGRFYSEIYLPLGGEAFFRKTFDRRTFRKILKAKVDGLPSAVHFAHIMHHVVEHSESDRFRRLSALGTYMIAEAEGLVGSQSEAERRWDKFKRTVSVLYAASTINANDGPRTILECLLGGKVFGMSASTTQKLLGRAKYYNEHVLSRLAPAKIADGSQAATAHLLNQRLFPDFVEEVAFQPAPSPLIKAGEIERRFAKAAPRGLQGHLTP